MISPLIFLILATKLHIILCDQQLVFSAESVQGTTLKLSSLMTHTEKGSITTTKHAELATQLRENTYDVAWETASLMEGGSPIPDVTSRDNVLNLAKMSWDAYTTPIRKDWLPPTGDWSNDTSIFGNDTSGLKGYIFTNEAETLVVVAIKGTSAAFLHVGGPTHDADKFNDNSMFSCCCAKVGFSWRNPTCGCYNDVGSGTCNSTCISKSLEDPASYFSIAQAMFLLVKSTYPKANIWLTGHSLGGSLSAALSHAYQVPSVNFEAPGEKLFVTRKGLMSEYEHIYHFGNILDPLFTGSCTGIFSACAIAGYAMESVCHTGQECVWTPRGRPNLQAHLLWGIIGLISNKNIELPACQPVNRSCVDCGWWKFVE